MNNPSAKKRSKLILATNWSVAYGELEIVRLKQPLVENTVVITGGSPRHKLHTPFGRCCGARIFRKLVADRETAGPHANLRRWRAPLLQWSTMEQCSTAPCQKRRQKANFHEFWSRRTPERKERYVRASQGHKENSRPESF